MKITALLLLTAPLNTASAFAPPRPPPLQHSHSRILVTPLAAEKPGFLKRVFGKGDKTEENVAATELEAAAVVDEECEVPEEDLNPVQKSFKQIKDAGVAGSISLFLWEGAFWAISIPVAITGYTSVTGQFPDLSDKEDLAKVGAEAFAFANVARLALPVRIALAISTTPWVQENIVDRFMPKEELPECDPGSSISTSEDSN